MHNYLKVSWNISKTVHSAVTSQDMQALITSDLLSHILQCQNMNKNSSSKYERVWYLWLMTKVYFTVWSITINIFHYDIKVNATFVIWKDASNQTLNTTAKASEYTHGLWFTSQQLYILFKKITQQIQLKLQLIITINF